MADSKQVLQQLLQKKLKTIPKGAVVYKTEETNGGFKCTLTIPGDGGKKFVGTVAKEKKVAEASAAKKAADAYAKEVGAVAKKAETPKETKKKEKTEKKEKTKEKKNGKTPPPMKKKKEKKEPGEISQKQMLQALLQKKLKTPLTKASIVYTSAEVQGGFKCTLTIPCDGGKKFVGTVAPAKKAADDIAAKKAVDVYIKEVGEIAKKRKVGEPTKAAKRGLEPPFCKLNGLMPSITRAQVSKGDIVVDITEVAGDDGKPGYQCTLKVTTLPGHESTEFTGTPGKSKQEAKNKAAEEAVKMIENDDGIQQMITSAKEEKKQKEKERPRPSLVKFKAKLAAIKAERAKK